MPISQEEDKAIVTYPNTYCHRIRMKGSNLDISTIKCYKCCKIKTKKDFLYSLGLKSAKMIEVHYLMFFDEIYIYLMKDIVVAKHNLNIRHLGNKYNLYSFLNISFDKNEETKKFKLAIEYTNEEKANEALEKVYYFDEVVGIELVKVLEAELLSLGIIAQGYNNEEIADNNAQNPQDNNNSNNNNKQLEGEGNDGQEKEKNIDEKGNVNANKTDVVVEQYEVGKIKEIISKNDIKDDNQELNEVKQEIIDSNKVTQKEEKKEKEIEEPPIKNETNVNVNNDDNENQSKEKEKEKSIDE